MADNSYTDIMEKNHMEIPWHDYTENDRSEEHTSELQSRE